jgi:peptidoglycan-N-acetylglucosamine deacetylase
MPRRKAPVLIVILLGTWAWGRAAAAAPAPSQRDARFALDAAKARRIAGAVDAGRSLVPPAWPGGRRVAVGLTFDLDGELAWMDEPASASPGEVSRGRFGPRVGLDRILALLDRRGVPATFFLPALMIELHPEAVASIRRAGRHEIGFHGYAHESVVTLTEDEERDVLRRGLAVFRRAGVEPGAYRSPSWDFSRSTLGLLREFGFRVDSSLMADDRPYEILQDGSPAGIVELPVDWSLDDWPYFQLEWDSPLPVRDPAEVLAVWKEEFEGIRSDGGAFVLTFHPQVIGRWSRLRMLQRLLDHVDARGGAWYATLSQIAGHLAPLRDAPPR